MARKSSILVEPVKKGKRTYGAIYTFPNGMVCYLAWRRTKEIFRYGEKDISAAIRAGKAAWALDEETLLNLRAKGIKFVGVLDRDTGDKYMTVLDRFFDPKNAAILNYESRGGALQRYLPINQFRRQVGVAKI
jgi:hypothetical protein